MKLRLYSNIRIVFGGGQRRVAVVPQVVGPAAVIHQQVPVDPAVRPVVQVEEYVMRQPLRTHHAAVGHAGAAAAFARDEQRVGRQVVREVHLRSRAVGNN